LTRSSSTPRSDSSRAGPLSAGTARWSWWCPEPGGRGRPSRRRKGITSAYLQTDTRGAEF